MDYQNNNYPLSSKTSIIIGIAMEVHRNRGRGFSEIVYKDAMEYEISIRDIEYKREKEYVIRYKTSYSIINFMLILLFSIQLL